ncbi:uncharacterized protein BJ212DRAFT_101548 [Suillus subaureus]|uniref:Uncharacterized protein n=1 Tax=Suillus subaureus TaxID=48587 RepID=A0A9P7EDZ9_9AGAM|nr:uncharacterized protein BJ212DRAFT_101548 [Suillus subaureus]KAG1818649.1 hypothetical protein BJ212DRAFT_101548 [Suillus subaureus]
MENSGLIQCTCEIFVSGSIPITYAHCCLYFSIIRMDSYRTDWLFNIASRSARSARQHHFHLAQSFLVPCVNDHAQTTHLLQAGDLSVSALCAIIQASTITLALNCHRTTWKYMCSIT